MNVEWVWNSFGIRGESIRNSYGIRLELICKSDGWFGNVLGMHRGCWGMNVGFVGNYYECFGKQLVFIGNPWDISGDFWLGIHSLGEVQIQTEHIHTHAISLTKPRFPFHVLTGSWGSLFFSLLFRSFFRVVLGGLSVGFWARFGSHFASFFPPFFHHTNRLLF